MKYWRSRKTPKMLVIDGSMSDQCVSIRLSVRISMKTGMIVICAGTIRAVSSTMNSMSRPGKSRRPKA